jgi:serine/threonine-protein kinase
MRLRALPAVAPRHLTSESPVSRAFRWLKSVTGTEVPGATNRAASVSEPRETHETPQTSIGEERKSVAILPFKNRSNDAETAFYEFSLADAVITDLARVRSLVVRPSSAIAKYQGKQVDPEEAGREMSVDAILTASFLRAGERLRDRRSARPRQGILWSERIDGDASDIIAVQTRWCSRLWKDCG